MRVDIPQQPGENEMYRLFACWTYTGSSTPVVGFVKPDFTPIIDKNEVESAFEVPLAHVLDRKNHLVHTTHRDKKAFPIYFIPWKNRMIWGATAAMLRNLSHHIHP